MNPYVARVEALPEYRLRLWFDNNEVRIFDMRPYLERGVFTRLKPRHIFEQPSVVAGSVEWSCDVDLSYDTLYLESVLETRGDDSK